MSNRNGILARLAEILFTALGSDRASRTAHRPRRPDSRLRSSADTSAPTGVPGDARRAEADETIRIDPQNIKHLQVAYAPERDGAADSGEIIWTWVPYEENDGRGKDRPLLVIGRASRDRVYAVRMTSKPHDGDRDFLSIGSGAWDSQGRESWVDIEQLYSVHETGLRREAAVLDRRLYDRVVDALTRRYGWAATG